MEPVVLKSQNITTSEFLSSQKRNIKIGAYVLVGLAIVVIYGFLNYRINNFATLALGLTKPVIVLNVESQDGLRVVINGSVGPVYVGVVSMTWNWGDGSQNEGFFPQSHSYSQPGKYKIIATARSLFGQGDGYVELSVTVPPNPPQLELSSPALKDMTLSVNGYVQDADRLVWNWGDGSPLEETWFSGNHAYKSYGDYIVNVTAYKGELSMSKNIRVSIKDQTPPTLETFIQDINGLKVTINGNTENTNKIIWYWGDDKSEDSWFPAVHAYLKSGTYEVTAKALGADKVTPKRFSVTVPRVDEFITLQGSQSNFFKFPKRFFDESVVTDKQILAVTDAQYQGLKKMHNGLVPYVSTKIEYNPAVYGVTSPEGIVLGDAAFPALNGGDPRWEVMSHEQGHNFFGGTSAFYYSIASPGPFLQESFAVLSAFYTYYDILENAKKYGINEDALNSLRRDFKNGEDYQKKQYETYIKDGAVFDVSDVLTSQALDYVMILKGEQYGWNNYALFARAFDDGMANQFTFQNDGVSDVEKSTYVIATLNATFNNDFRKEFINLNFPIDQVLYKEVFNKISDFINNNKKTVFHDDSLTYSTQIDNIFSIIRNFFNK